MASNQGWCTKKNGLTRNHDLSWHNQLPKHRAECPLPDHFRESNHVLSILNRVTFSSDHHDWSVAHSVGKCVGGHFQEGCLERENGKEVNSPYPHKKSWDEEKRRCTLDKVSFVNRSGHLFFFVPIDAGVETNSLKKILTEKSSNARSVFWFYRSEPP